MQFGEIVRRSAFNALDAMRGGKLKRLLEVNKREIVEGVTDDYAERRISLLLDYASEKCPFYRGLENAEALSDYPVQNKADFISRYDTILSDEFRAEKDQLTKLSTSGSTGTPFTVLADPEKMNHVNMNFMSVME